MTEKKPNIRFKGFEEEWEDKPFADEADTRRGLTYSPSSICQKGIRVLRSSNISDDSFVKSDDDVFVEESAINIDYAKNNDILITAANGSQRLVGKHCLISGIEEKSTVHGGFMLLASAKNPHFLNASMGSSWYRDFINFFVAGGNGAIGNLNKADLDSYIIRVPSETEQQKIGEFFKQLDELIGAKEQELEKLRQIKLALLDKMFPSDSQDNINGGGKSLIYKTLQNSLQLVVSSPAPNTPTIRFRGFTEPWEKYLISRRVTYGKGRGYSKANLQQSGTPILLYGTLYTDYNTNITEVDRYSTKKEWAVMSKGNEVVVPASGETAEDIARASAILKAGIILGGDLNIIYPDDKLDASFLALELTYGNSHRKLVKKAQGISVVHLHNTDISELEINVPSYNEQRKIGDFFRSQDEAIANSQLQINKLKTIKQACLSQMFA